MPTVDFANVTNSNSLSIVVVMGVYIKNDISCKFRSKVYIK